MMQQNTVEKHGQIAVIIPLYNGEKWIRQTLGSILSQRLKAAEVIVVDDGSTDSSRDIVSQIKGIKLFKNPLKGANHARAFGLSQSNSALIAMVDQDDILHPEHFERLNGLLLKYPESPAAVATTVSFKKELEGLFNHDRPVSAEYELMDPWDRFPFNFISTPSSVLMRSSALKKAGGWQVNWPGVADCYCWFALALQSPLLLSKTKTLAKRVHRDSYCTELRKKSLEQFYTNFIESSRHLLSLKPGPENIHNDLFRRIDALALVKKLISPNNPCQTDISANAAWKNLEDLYISFPKHIRKDFCSTVRWYFQPDRMNFRNNRHWISFICSGLKSGFPKIQDFTKRCSEKELSFYLNKKRIKRVTRVYLLTQLMKRKTSRQKFRNKQQVR